MKMLYLDESGNHDLTHINTVYPVFVLGGVIVERAYVRDVVEPSMRQFKRRYFGREDVILHTVDMSRGRGDYAFLADAELRSRFYIDLNQMLARLEYQVVACVIDKIEYVRRFGLNAPDPYRYGLEVLVECFCEELGDTADSGFICAEKRNPGLDRGLMEAWEMLLRSGVGAGQVDAAEIDRKVVGLELRDKKPNLAGMQLADLVITPIGRRVARRPATANQVRWEVVESKLRRVHNAYSEKGLMIRP